MTFSNTPLQDLTIIQPRVFEDDRGYFYESFNQTSFSKQFKFDSFVQDNQSLSKKNVIRGLHFQNPPYAQIKLVRVIKGAVIDVAVDIRKNSLTYGQHFKIELNERNKTMLWIPEGFAHGFVTLEDDTIFVYKCSALYNKASEGCIVWNDHSLGIDWEVKNPIVSEKDMQGVDFKNFTSLF